MEAVIYDRRYVESVIINCWSKDERIKITNLLLLFRYLNDFSHVIEKHLDHFVIAKKLAFLFNNTIKQIPDNHLLDNNNTAIHLMINKIIHITSKYSNDMNNLSQAFDPEYIIELVDKFPQCQSTEQIESFNILCYCIEKFPIIILINPGLIIKIKECIEYILELVSSMVLKDYITLDAAQSIHTNALRLQYLLTQKK